MSNYIIEPGSYVTWEVFRVIEPKIVSTDVESNQLELTYLDRGGQRDEAFTCRVHYHGTDLRLEAKVVDGELELTAVDMLLKVKRWCIIEVLQPDDTCQVTVVYTDPLS